MSDDHKTRNPALSLEDGRHVVGEILDVVPSLTKAYELESGMELEDEMPLEAGTRNAFDIQEAIKVASRILPVIGTCPIFMKNYAIYELDLEEYEISPMEWAQKLITKEKPSGPLIDLKVENFTLLDTIQQSIDDLENQFESSIVAETDYSENPLFSNDCTVTIALPALQNALGRDSGGKSTFSLGDFLLPLSKFDLASKSVIGSEVSESSKSGPDSELDDQDDSWSLLDALLTLGTTSPYGQVSTLRTIVDETIHKAKQIDASNFSVSETFISKVEEFWGDHFHPAKVRAEPYKIKLYSPDGMFRTHKDTPETGLVGTFLVGLTSPYLEEDHLKLDGSRTWSSINGSYCAFYTDVVHQVLPLPNSRSSDLNQAYPTRGTIAFKIFALPSPQPVLEIFDETVMALNSSVRPFGILLRHSYTTECRQGLLKGADAALYQALTQLERVKIHVIPVLTDFQLEREISEEIPRADLSYFQVKVYPFSEIMIRACLADPEDAAAVPPYWPPNLRKIPFLTTKGWNERALTLKNDPGADYTGNDSRPAEEHSIYLSAAIIVSSN